MQRLSLQQGNESTHVIETLWETQCCLWRTCFASYAGEIHKNIIYFFDADGMKIKISAQR